MAIDGSNSLPLENERCLEHARHRSPTAVSILDTTELRWFVPGRLPADIGAWFNGSTGVHQHRCDTYLLDGLPGGRSDMGVKRRFGETLELKIRQSLDGPIHLSDGLAGPLEVWRRWSPAQDLVTDSSNGRWVDIYKSIVKRRFSPNGNEIAFSTNLQVNGGGCDVEMTEVGLGTRRWWTFAFAAFGPQAIRRDAMLASWSQIFATTPCRALIESCNSRSMGYPEWLALTASPDGELAIDQTCVLQ